MALRLAVLTLALVFAGTLAGLTVSDLVRYGPTGLGVVSTLISCCSSSVSSAP